MPSSLRYLATAIAAAPRSRSLARAVPAAACAVLSVVVLLHVGLIGRARWQADDYFYAHLIRQLGFSMFLNSVTHWSPRPFPLLLQTLYALAINHWRRPFVASFTLLLWAMLTLSVLGPALLWRRRGEGLAFLLLGLGLFALLLLGHPIAELFFWPASAAAYLLSLAGAVWLFWCLAAPSAESGDGRLGWGAVALVLAAGSSEIGMCVALSFCGCAMLLRLRGAALRLAWLAPSALMSAYVLATVLHGRIGTPELPGDPHVIGHPLASLRPTLHEFFVEAVVAPGLAGWAGRIALLLTSRWVLLDGPGGRRPSGALLALGLSLPLAAFVSLWASYFEFGLLCCQRHVSMRDCLLVLGFAALGAWSARRFPAVRPGAVAQALPLALAALLLCALRGGLLREAYRAYPGAIQARAMTWQSGLMPGDRMTYVLVPDGVLIGNGEFLAPGTYDLEPDSPWYLAGLLHFFDKRTVRVEPAPR